MIVKVCDRCGKQYNPPPSYMQAILPIYRIIKNEAFSHIEIDLCKECQDDFDKWMKEKLGNGEDNE